LARNICIPQQLVDPASKRMSDERALQAFASMTAYGMNPKKSDLKPNWLLNHAGASAFESLQFQMA